MKANLGQFNSDSAGPMRGKAKGALRLLSIEAPMVQKTDIGGDVLHHVHNANKNVHGDVFSYDFSLSLYNA